MKKSLSLAVVISILFLNILYAAIITVDNKHPYAGDYKTLQEAHDAASNGDVIYVSPSLIPYSGIQVIRQLIFYGVGFEITQKYGESITPTVLIDGNMQFASGAEGSILEGFDGAFTITISCDNITLKRNYMSSILFNISLGSGSSIVQNKIISTSGGHQIWNGNYVPNILIANNILVSIEGSILGGGNEFYVYNNIIKAPDEALGDLQNSQVMNNIIISGNINECETSTFIYNMANSNQLPEGNGNINNVDMSTVFVDYVNYDFHLLPGSPAIGAGQNGVDMGIYGGETPYIDCGFPGLPSILQIQAPNAGSQQSGLDISFKAKSNKE